MVEGVAPAEKFVGLRRTGKRESGAGQGGEDVATCRNCFAGLERGRGSRGGVGGERGAPAEIVLLDCEKNWEKGVGAGLGWWRWRARRNGLWVKKDWDKGVRAGLGGARWRARRNGLWVKKDWEKGSKGGPGWPDAAPAEIVLLGLKFSE